MRALYLTTLALVGIVLMQQADAGGKQAAADPREALQALQDFIGSWKGSGNSEKNKSEVWKENLNWGWRFKGKEAWLSADVTQSKFYKGAEIRYLPDRDLYQLTLEDKQGKKQVYEGTLKKDALVVERVNPENNDTEQIKINSAAGGDRLVYTFFSKAEGRTQFFKQYQYGFTKEGVTFGFEPGSKKPECVVTGGLGTIAVSYMGTTYYVCCSGCRDAFNENPAKILAEYRAKKK